MLGDNPKGGNAYRKYLDVRVRLGHWSPLFRDHVVGLGIRNAALVAHVLTVGKATADPQLWVPATEAFLTTGLGLTAGQQTKLLESLTELGVVEVALRGGGSLRHIRIDLDQLDEIAGA